MRYHYLIAVLLILIAELANARQNPCTQTADKKRKIDTLNQLLKQVTRDINSTQLSRSQRAQKLEEKNALLIQIRQASKTAAALLQECLTRYPDPETELIRKYQIAKFYINAEDCPNAYTYIKDCRNHPKLNGTKLGNQPISNYVSFLMEQCTSTGDSPREEYLSVVYGGKGLYFQLNRVDSIDNRPFTGDELEILASRRLTRQNADTSLAVFKQLSHTNQVYYNFPFVLVAGPGKYHYNAVKPEKTPPGKDLYGDNDRDYEAEINQSNNPLKYIYTEIIAPYYTHLKRKYFDSLTFNYVLPVYLSGGDFKQQSYDSFSRFCEEVHLRSPGPRVAYYSPVDKSIMAWMPTGGGTLIHEMVHALMDNDFKNPPAWLSEGLASLYEEVDKATLKPKDNYRIYYINTFKRQMQCHLSIEKLVSLTATDLSNANTGMLYSAYARYLAKYLLEKGMLDLFYKTVRNQRGQLNELEALKRILNKSITQIQSDWESWLNNKPLPSKWQSLSHNISDYIYKNKALMSCR